MKIIRQDDRLARIDDRVLAVKAESESAFFHVKNAHVGWQPSVTANSLRSAMLPSMILYGIPFLPPLMDFINNILAHFIAIAKIYCYNY